MTVPAHHSISQIFKTFKNPTHKVDHLRECSRLGVSTPRDKSFNLFNGEINGGNNPQSHGFNHKQNNESFRQNFVSGHMNDSRGHVMRSIQGQNIAGHHVNSRPHFNSVKGTRDISASDNRYLYVDSRNGQNHATSIDPREDGARYHEAGGDSNVYRNRALHESTEDEARDVSMRNQKRTLNESTEDSTGNQNRVQNNESTEDEESQVQDNEESIQNSSQNLEGKT